MENKYPAHAPTVKLINCAYPDGIPHAHYMTLLSILANNMSIRQLANVIAYIRGGNYAVYMSDVMSAITYHPDDALLSTVKNKLLLCGYEIWIKET